MLAQQVIAKKRDGKALTQAEVAFIVKGISDGSVSDAQLGAFAMAVFHQGMTVAERVDLTHYMQHSGKVLQWHDMHLPGPIVDKHSTGGVGDKVSLILAPLVAACGAYVPMISGRGLGHTGGTLDKLESLAGYNPYPSEAKFKQTVKQVGCAVIGQTDDLAPADRRLYATRDVTATVESIDLITASILSKKLAAGLQGLVMDIKTGSGAFASSMTMAQELAEAIVEVSTGAGVPCCGVITDMNQVLGKSVGNQVEVQESVDCLMNPQAADPRLLEITLRLAAHMLCLTGLAEDIDAALDKANKALETGLAAEQFAQMCHAMGVKQDVLQKKLFADMPIIKPIVARETGYLGQMDTHTIGMAMVEVGAGRRIATDTIDHGLGLCQVRPLGSVVKKGEPMAMAHVRNGSQLALLQAAFDQALTIDNSPSRVVDSALIKAVISPPTSV